MRLRDATAGRYDSAPGSETVSWRFVREAMAPQTVNVGGVIRKTWAPTCGRIKEEQVRESQHVFVGGLHRSGTTPLAQILGAHPEISALSATGVPEDEGEHLQDVFPKIRAYGGMSQFARADAAHLTESSPLVSARNRAALMSAWSPYWDLSRRYLLEKSPANMIRFRFLEALFPGSHFIAIVRHPVVAALAIQKWNPVIVARNGRRRASLSRTVDHWERAHAILRDDTPYLQNLHVMCYERLVANPEFELKKLQQFLGLSAPIDSDAIKAGLNGQYAQQWKAMATRGILSRGKYEKIVRMRLPEAAAYGYDMKDLSVLPE